MPPAIVVTVEVNALASVRPFRNVAFKLEYIISSLYLFRVKATKEKLANLS